MANGIWEAHPNDLVLGINQSWAFPEGISVLNESGQEVIVWITAMENLSLSLSARNELHASTKEIQNMRDRYRIISDDVPDNGDIIDEEDLHTVVFEGDPNNLIGGLENGVGGEEPLSLDVIKERIFEQAMRAGVIPRPLRIEVIED